MYDRIFDAAELLVFIIQGWCLQSFYGQFMESRFHGCGRYAIAPVWLMVRLLCNLLPVDYDIMQSIGKVAVRILGLGLATAAFYKAGAARKLYLSVTFLAVTEISFFLAYMVLAVGTYIFYFWTWCLENGYIASADRILQLTTITAIVLQVLMYVLFCLLSVLLLKLLARCYKEKEYEVQKNELMFILTPSMIGLLLCILLRIIIVSIEDGKPVLLYQKYPLLLVLFPAILVLSLLSILYGIQLLQDMISLNREKSGRLILEQQVSSMQEHFQEMDRIYSGIRSMKHDMRNQLAVLNQLAEQKDTQRLRAYLLEMNQTMEQLDYRFRTGNTVADIILNMKYHEAAAKMPEIVIEAEELIFPKRLWIRSYDLAVVLGNALDNAIEACAGMQDGAERFIRLKAWQKGKLFFLEIENSFNGRLLCSGQSEFPQSSKRDKGLHGIGLCNIKAAVWEYEGAVDWEAEGSTFFLTVMMKNEERSGKEEER